MIELTGKQAVHRTKRGWSNCTITKVEEGYVYIRHRDESEMKLQFPQAFEHFLMLKEVNLQAKIERLAEEHNRKEKEKRLIEKDIKRKKSNSEEKVWLCASYKALERTLKNARYDLRDMEEKGEAPKEKPEYLLDYDCPWEQAAYVLRYSYAYAFEYYQMYRAIFEEFSFNNELKVLSIGCGTLLDAWALDVAVREVGIEKNTEYVGVDLAEWNVDYQPKTEVVKKHAIFGAYAGEYLSSLSMFDFDIIVFPKSLRDIYMGEKTDFMRVLDSFEKTDIQKNRLILAFSLTNKPNAPGNEEYLNEDFNNIYKIKKSLKNNDFVVDEDKTLKSKNSNHRVDYLSGYPKIDDRFKEAAKELTEKSMMTSRSYQKYVVYELKR